MEKHEMEPICNVIPVEKGTQVLQNQSLSPIEFVSKEFLKRRRLKTPSKVIKTREGKKGKVFRYIDRITAMRWLDTYYPGWSWEFDPTSIKEVGGFLYGSGRLTVWEPLLQRDRVIQSVGSDEIILSKDTKEWVPAEYAKSIDTDSLKRCVFTLGGFTDVYSATPEATCDLDEVECSEILALVNEVIELNKSMNLNPTDQLDRLINLLSAYKNGTLLAKDIIATINHYKG